MFGRSLALVEIIVYWSIIHERIAVALSVSNSCTPLPQNWISLHSSAWYETVLESEI